jgi:hypothetical protein
MLAHEADISEHKIVGAMVLLYDWIGNPMVIEDSGRAMLEASTALIHDTGPNELQGPLAVTLSGPKPSQLVTSLGMQVYNVRFWRPLGVRSADNKRESPPTVTK